MEDDPRTTMTLLEVLWLLAAIVVSVLMSVLGVTALVFLVWFATRIVL